MGKRKRGRPVIPPVSGERIAMSLRVTADVKRKLEQAAIESGRSLSQEAELRLTESFEREWIVERLKTWLRKEVRK
jgi:predicted transcriptional regulator